MITLTTIHHNTVLTNQNHCQRHGQIWVSTPFKTFLTDIDLN